MFKKNYIWQFGNRDIFLIVLNKYCIWEREVTFFLLSQQEANGKYHTTQWHYCEGGMGTVAIVQKPSSKLISSLQRRQSECNSSSLINPQSLADDFFPSQLSQKLLVKQIASPKSSNLQTSYLYMTNTCPPSAWGRNTDTKPQTNYFKTLMLVAQWCPTLCNPMDCGLAGSSVHEIVQARILKWVAILFSREFSWLKDQTRVSCIAGRFFTEIWATSGSHYSKISSKSVCGHSHKTQVEGCVCVRAQSW